MMILKSFIFVVLIFCSTFTRAEDPLIQEIDSLRTSLPFGDPSYNELTLRLADLYFNNSLKDDTNKNGKLKAIKLYEEILNGKNGAKVPSSDDALKIHFQLARLFDRLIKPNQAKKHFEIVFNDKNVSSKLKREAALSLGEIYETDANYKKADIYFTSAIELCGNIDVCSYAHHRKGWLFYKKGETQNAINETRLGLWSANGELREVALKDFILFLGNADSTDGIKELKEIEAISLKTSKPELITTLAESFYSSGNRLAGTNVLTYANKKSPSLYSNVRLIEENIGFKNFDEVGNYLDKLKVNTAKDLPTDPTTAGEVSKMMKRVVVQLDALRKNDQTHNSMAKKSIEVYLSLYPSDELKEKMREGWLATTTDEKEKIDKLAIWIKEENGVSSKHLSHLHHTRLALAQNQKLEEVVSLEAKTLITLTDKPEQKREYEYILAKSFYNQKKYTEALKGFLNLANIKKTAEIDSWAVMSQNLVLDIYNQNKDFKNLITQAQSWTNNERFYKNPKYKKELAEQNKIISQATFEQAAGLGESQMALDEFFNFCMKDLFADKSCPNAKVLAVKLKDQDKVIKLLIKENNTSALIGEYEAMGEFKKAALLKEKNLNAKSDIQDYFKTALLYELDFDTKSRDQILEKLTSLFKKQGKIDPKYENLYYLTLKDANKLDLKALTIPWSLKFKLKLANVLQSSKDNKITRNIILSADQSTGDAWSKLVLENAEQINQKQASIGFYGARSEVLFKRRVKAITKLRDETSKYLEKAKSKTRIYLLTYLESAYKNLADEINNTPLPKDLDSETLAEVKASLLQMATPFTEAASNYTNLKNTEIATFAEADKKDLMTSLKTNENFSLLFKTQDIETKNIMSLRTNDYEKARKMLLENPQNTQALTMLAQLCNDLGWERLSGYYKARTESVTE